MVEVLDWDWKGDMGLGRKVNSVLRRMKWGRCLYWKFHYLLSVSDSNYLSTVLRNVFLLAVVPNSGALKTIVMTETHHQGDRLMHISESGVVSASFEENEIGWENEIAYDVLSDFGVGVGVKFLSPRPVDVNFRLEKLSLVVKRFDYDRFYVVSRMMYHVLRGSND